MSVMVGGSFSQGIVAAKACCSVVCGILPGRVVVIGGGTSGMNAARMATGPGADVTV